MSKTPARDPFDEAGYRWPVPPYSLTRRRRVELSGRSDVTWIDIVLLEGLIDFDIPASGYRKGIVWPKARTLAKTAGLSEHQVRDSREHLELAGLISVERTPRRSDTPRVIIHWNAVVVSSTASESDDSFVPRARSLRTPGAKPFVPPGRGLYNDQAIEKDKDSGNLNAGASRDQHDADTRSSSGNGNAPTEPTAAEILDRLHRQLRWLGLPATLTRLNRSRYVTFLDSVIEQESARVVSAVFYSLQDFRSTWPVQAGLAACLSDRGFEALWQLTGAGADILDAQ